MTSLPQWSLDQVFDQMNSKTHWSGNITYGYPTSTAQYSGSGEELAGFQPVSLTQQSWHNLAFETWADLISSKLTLTSGSAANINVGYTDKFVEYAHAYYPTDGSIWLNKTITTGENNLAVTPVGSYGFSTIVHEIGHALGLNHMGNYNGAEGKSASSFQDSTVLSVMSYYGPSSANGGEGQVQWGNWVGSDGVSYSTNTPMLNDIYVIQKIYGVSTTTRSEDTVYGFNSNIQGNASSIYNFAINKYPILAIFDAGGNNTIDLSGYQTSSLIDLRAGGISSINGMTNNLEIAYNTLIQKFIGGGGGDDITGNDASDTIVTNAGDDTVTALSGNDVIDGGSGFDAAAFRGSRADYTVTKNNSGVITVVDNTVSRDGTDTLISIEKIKFSDSDILASDISGNGNVFSPPTNPIPSNVLNTAVSILTTAVDTFGNTFGYFIDAANKTQGFTVSGGAFLTVDVPGSTLTKVTGTTPTGIMGFYNDSSNLAHGFIRNQSQVTLADHPLGTYGTWLTTGNSSQAAGAYCDASGKLHGYIQTFSTNGVQFSTVDNPLGVNGTWFTSLSSDGKAAGFYIDASNTYHGFVYQGGNFTNVNVVSSIHTIPIGINSGGQVVGEYMDAKGWHGFLYSNGNYTPYDYAGASLTAFTGINDSGSIVGIATVGINTQSFATHL